MKGCVDVFFNTFIYLVCTVSLLLCQLFSRCREQGLVSSCRAQASRCGNISCCGARALGCLGFSSCGSWALEHKFNSCGARQLLHSMWDLTCVSCFGRWVLYHWATRETLVDVFYTFSSEVHLCLMGLCGSIFSSSVTVYPGISMDLFGCGKTECVIVCDLSNCVWLSAPDHEFYVWGSVWL